MKPHSTLRRLDELIQSRSILRHPFYIAWERGELSRDQLATYAMVYYPHVASFPGYLRSACGSAEDHIVRSELERNLADEISHPKPHNELWLDFAESLGLDRMSVANAAPRPAAENIVNTLERLTGGESAMGLAALCAYESQQPEVSRKKVDGLRRYYGVDSPKALAYFEVHAEIDVHHRDGLRNALLRCIANGASPDVILVSANRALDSYWGLLDGICEEADITIPC
ncbi:MAG: iron-containing redox enzyme family protein [Nitrospirales bacterium]